MYSIEDIKEVCLSDKHVLKIKSEITKNGILTKFCVCKKFFQIKSNAKFYPTITYLYCELEGFFPNENLVVFAENQKVYITEDEFNENFIDLREYKINSIIN
jgi:hypothetical protein